MVLITNLVGQNVKKKNSNATLKYQSSFVQEKRSTWSEILKNLVLLKCDLEPLRYVVMDNMTIVGRSTRGLNGQLTNSTRCWTESRYIFTLKALSEWPVISSFK